MASTVAVLLLLSAGLFTVGFGDDCRSYTTSSNEYKSSIICQYGLHCCGTCNKRYCCSSTYLKLTDQNVCNVLSSSQSGGSPIIISGIMVIVITCVVFVICCCCPCCCMYNMCRKPRPVVGGTHITTVMNTQCVQQQQQPVMQPAQYPAYQPVPTQPGYGAQPGPYQGQPYAPGPPPPYHIAANPGYPGSQAPYDGSQATYPMMPPAHPGSAYPAHPGSAYPPPAQSGIAYPPPETFDQPAYNPAYMQPPKTGY
ncbi:hypothetical protein R3I94_017950 [Phoxinus phoxinus]